MTALRKIFLTLTLLAAALPLAAQNASAGKTFYVSSAEELAALGTLKEGSRVVWRNGVYDSQALDLRGRGTAENPVIFTAQTAGKVVFTGTSTLTVSGSHVAVEGFWWKNPVPTDDVKSVVTLSRKSDHCTLRNCAVTGEDTAEDAEHDTKWVSLYGSENTVSECTFLDKRNMGTLLVVWLENDIVPRHTIADNTFTRPVTLYDENNKPINGQETIRIGTSAVSMQRAECVVEGNCFYHCHGEQAETVSNKSCANIYRRNLFVECKGTLTLRHGNDCLVAGNYFLGNNMQGTGGVRIIGERHTVERNWFENLAGTGFRAAICMVQGQENPKLSGYWQVKNARVAYNTLVDCKYGISVNYASKTSNQVLPVISSVIENNTVSVQSNSKYAVYVADGPKPKVKWRDNTIYGRVYGASVGTVGTSPVKPQMRAAVKTACDNIVEAAGCKWMRITL